MEGHELREACGRNGSIRVALEKDRAGFRFHENGRTRIEGGGVSVRSDGPGRRECGPPEA